MDPRVSSDDLYNRIVDLKMFAENTSPGIQVTVSCPLVRTDNAHANAKLVQLKGKLIKSAEDGLMKIIRNDNITEEHLSIKGLHLKQGGTVQLAKNMIEFMKNIEQGV